jgi:hypothetical protein
MPHEPLDPSEQNEAKKQQRDARARLELQNESDDFKWLMSSKRGRRIVWRFLEQAGVFRLSFNTNAMQMAFAEGQRSFGNRTLAQVHSLCPEQYPVMLAESTKT